MNKILNYLLIVFISEVSVLKSEVSRDNIIVKMPTVKKSFDEEFPVLVEVRIIFLKISLFIKTSFRYKLAK